MTTTKIVNLRTNLDSVIERTGFTSADEKYEALVAASQDDGWTLSDHISDCTGTAELSEIESQIFGIEARDVPALYWAYERYESFIGSMDTYFGEFTAEERVDYRCYFKGERQWSFDNAVNFMMIVCGLTFPKCLAWVSKIVAGQVRGGLYDTGGLQRVFTELPQEIADRHFQR